MCKRKVNVSTVLVCVILLCTFSNVFGAPRRLTGDAPAPPPSTEIFPSPPSTPPPEVGGQAGGDFGAPPPPQSTSWLDIIKQFFGF